MNAHLAMLMTCPKCGSTTLGGHVCGILDNSPGLDVVPRSEIEVANDRIRSTALAGIAYAEGRITDEELVRRCTALGLTHRQAIDYSIRIDDGLVPKIPSDEDIRRALDNFMFGGG